MTNIDFNFEFIGEIPDPGGKLRAEAEDRLIFLTKGHKDLIGATVTIEELTGETTPHCFKVTVVVYKRPDTVAATEKGESAEIALKGALNAIERQIRDLRDRLRETWK